MESSDMQRGTDGERKGEVIMWIHKGSYGDWNSDAIVAQDGPEQVREF